MDTQTESASSLGAEASSKGSPFASFMTGDGPSEPEVKQPAPQPEQPVDSGIDDEVDKENEKLVPKSKRKKGKAEEAPKATEEPKPAEPAKVTEQIVQKPSDVIGKKDEIIQREKEKKKELQNKLDLLDKKYQEAQRIGDEMTMKLAAFEAEKIQQEQILADKNTWHEASREFVKDHATFIEQAAFYNERLIERPLIFETLDKLDNPYGTLEALYTFMDQNNYPVSVLLDQNRIDDRQLVLRLKEIDASLKEQPQATLPQQQPTAAQPAASSQKAPAQPPKIPTPVTANTQGEKHTTFNSRPNKNQILAMYKQKGPGAWLDELPD